MPWIETALVFALVNGAAVLPTILLMFRTWRSEWRWLAGGMAAQLAITGSVATQGLDIHGSGALFLLLTNAAFAIYYLAVAIKPTGAWGMEPRRG